MARLDRLYRTISPDNEASVRYTQGALGPLQEASCSVYLPVPLLPVASFSNEATGHGATARLLCMSPIHYEYAECLLTVIFILQEHRHHCLVVRSETTLRLIVAWTSSVHAL